MSDTILAEDSTPFKLAPNLERILKRLKKDADHHDHLVALLIVMMNESGFCISKHSNEEEDPTQTWSFKCKIDIPNNWKCEERGIYEIAFQLCVLPNTVCKLLAIPSGNTLILNLIPQNPGMKCRSLAVQSTKYVNCLSKEEAGRFMNIKDLSIRFKDDLLNPVRCEFLMDAGMVNPSLQGLPTDLKLQIMELLNIRAVMRLAQCSQEFYKLSKEPSLWRKLVRRDFKKHEITHEDYKAQYMTQYVQYRRKSRRRII